MVAAPGGVGTRSIEQAAALSPLLEVGKVAGAPGGVGTPQHYQSGAAGGQGSVGSPGAVWAAPAVPGCATCCRPHHQDAPHLPTTPPPAAPQHLDPARHPLPEPYPFAEARQLFLQPNVLPADALPTFKWAAPNEEGLVAFLCGAQLPVPAWDPGGGGGPSAHAACLCAQRVKRCFRPSCMTASAASGWQACIGHCP